MYRPCKGYSWYAQVGRCACYGEVHGSTAFARGSIEEWTVYTRSTFNPRVEECRTIIQGKAGLLKYSGTAADCRLTSQRTMGLLGTDGRQHDVTGND